MPDQALTGLPAPCLEVNAAAGYAVVPDPKKPLHLLLVPTRRLTGIEDPALLQPGTPNYWEQAWIARRHLEARLKRRLPREAVGLAVNAIAGRSQEQLHIHISCIRPEVSRELEALGGAIGPWWSAQPIRGWPWRVRSLSGSDLSVADPFRLLAKADPGAQAHMGELTLVVVGARLPQGDGFYLLSRATDPSGDSPGHGELLLDESCRGDD